MHYQLFATRLARAAWIVLMIGGPFASNLSAQHLRGGSTVHDRQNAAANSAFRRYNEGPLKVEEFKAQPVPGGNLSALTYAELRFSFKYRYSQTRSGFVAKAYEVDVYAVFRPERSWLKGAEGRGLLEHEQGHFDLMQIYALQTRLEIQKTLRRYVASAPTKNQAVDRLRELIDKRVNDAYEKCAEAQKQYDYQTKHGRRKDAQGLYTREQRAKLSELKSQIAESR